MQLFFLNIIKGNKTGFVPSIIKFFAFLCSWPYRFAVLIRNKLFDCGFLKETAFPKAYVISIGNIVAGGTGKTPFTQLLASELAKTNKIAILTRGYHSKAENNSPYVIQKETTVSECGDEAILLSKNIPNCKVIVGKNRCLSAAHAVGNGAEFLICDDAFQHRYIKRNKNIVVINASDPFGQNHFLPRGLLRESPKSLKRADFLVIHGVENQQQYEQLKKQISRFTKAPMIGTVAKVDSCLLLDGTPIDITNKKIALFCAIGNPERFVKTAQSLKPQILDQYFIPDHHFFCRKNLQNFANKNPQADYLICTEKDSVKLEPNLHLPIGFIKTKLEILYDISNWNYFFQSIKR